MYSVQGENMVTDHGIQYESGDSDSEDVEDWYAYTEMVDRKIYISFCFVFLHAQYS